MSHKVFVYGTLKRGFQNHDQWMSDFACIGPMRTLLAFPLLIGGPWFTIQMLPEPGRGHRVSGELYDVDDCGLALLDRLENIEALDGYTRRHIDVEGLNADVSANVWCYFKDRKWVDPVHSEPLRVYQFDPRYVPVADRT